MKTSAICQALLHEVCNENIAFYRRMTNEEPLEAVNDQQWQEIISLARSLTTEQRETLLAFARQVAVDAVSTVCGGIDGNTSLAGTFYTFTLTDADGQQHAGGLQDEFIALAYR